MGLEIVELALTVEEEFDFTMEDAEWQEARTLGALYEAVCRHTGVEPTRPPHDEVWNRLLLIFQERFGMKRDQLRYDARFIEDLRMD